MPIVGLGKYLKCRLFGRRNIFINKILIVVWNIMLDNREKSRANSKQRKRKPLFPGRGYSHGNNITGWNSQDSQDPFYESFLNYLTQARMSKGAGSRDFVEKEHKPKRFAAKDQNKCSVSIRHKSRLLAKLVQNTPSQAKTSRNSANHNSTYSNQNFHTQIIKTNARQVRKILQYRQNTLTQRFAARREYPKNVYEFVETRRELDQINYGSSEKSCSLMLDDTKAMKVLPKIKPFLNPNKLLKLQHVKRGSPPSKSPRLEILGQRNNSEHLEFNDQKIFCSSIQYQEH